MRMYCRCGPGAIRELRVAVGVWRDLGKWELLGRRVKRSEALSIQGLYSSPVIRSHTRDSGQHQAYKHTQIGGQWAKRPEPICVGECERAGSCVSLQSSSSNAVVSKIKKIIF